MFSACGPSGGSTDPDCDVEEDPAFRVLIRAEGDALPSDLALSVRFGGGSESYQLGGPTQGAERILFCESVVGPYAAPAEPSPEEEVDASATPLSDEGLECDVWADSSVTLSVSGTGFVPVERELRAVVDECGAITVYDAIALEQLVSIDDAEQ
jgi:hypothetical protein